MGHVNQLRFIEQQQRELCGPFLEVGSHDYGNTQDVRSLFAGEVYRGVDMIDGPGVDHVLDLAEPFEAIDGVLGSRFGTIFCLSVLEHCESPFRVAENMTRLLKPGGKIVVSVPFVFKFHGYPSDYWRFTHEGVKKLFPDLRFDPDRSNLSTDVPGEFLPLDEDLGVITLSAKTQYRKGHRARGLSLSVMKVFLRAGPLRWLRRYRRLYPQLMINMTGSLPDIEPAESLPAPPETTEPDGPVWA